MPKKAFYSPHIRNLMWVILVLVAGSVLVIYQCLAFNDGESWGLAVGPLWGLTMFIVWLFGNGALLVARHWYNLPLWLVVCLMAGIGLWPLVSFLQETVVPPAVQIMAPLVVLDVGIITAARWLMMSGANTAHSSKP